MNKCECSTSIKNTILKIFFTPTSDLLLPLLIGSFSLRVIINKNNLEISGSAPYSLNS